MNDQSKLQITEHQQGGVTVLTLAGELTLDDGDLAFGRYVDQMVAAGQRQIVVDLSRVSYIDSAGVGMLVAESKRVYAGRGCDAPRAAHGAKPSSARDAEAEVGFRDL